MRNQKGFIQTSIFITIIAGILILSGTVYFSVKRHQKNLQQKIKKELPIPDTKPIIITPVITPPSTEPTPIMPPETTIPKIKDSIPLKSSPADSPFGFHPSAVVPSEYKISSPFDFANDIGIKWDRPVVYFFWFSIQPDLNQPTFKWDNYDKYLKALPNAINLMGNIAIGSPRQAASRYTTYAKNEKSFLPKDAEAYKQFVKTVVERYDGDGKNDMSGLAKPIKYWQADNEPPHGMTDYAEFLKITYEAVKEADPSAKVIIGGVPGMPPTSDYLKIFDKFYLPILNDLAKSNKKYFDVFDFHWYGNATDDYRGVKEVFEHIKNKVDALGLTPPDGYWITEMGTYSGDPLPMPAVPGLISTDYSYQTEKQQAIDLVKRYVYPLSFGIKKIFMAFGLTEGFQNDGGYFDFNGLIYDGKFNNDQGKGVKKLGYYTYKKMTEILEGSDWENIKMVQEKDGVYVYKFTKSNKSIWAAWNDNSASKQISISGISSGSVKITEAIPKYDSGKNVTDYSTAFNTETKTVSEGKISITLGDKPVFVEE